MISDRHRISLGIFIGAVAIFGCFILRNIFIDHANSEIQKYNTAIRVEDDDKFNYAVDSKQGRIISSGEFKTKDPVKFENFDGEYMKIIRILEEYRPHTYVTCNGKGKCQTHTYYSWDEVSRETKNSNTIIFRDREYSSSKFNFSAFEHEAEKKEIPTKFLERKKRYVFRVINKELSGSFYTETNENGLNDNILVHNESLDELLESIRQGVLTTEIISWLVLLVVVTSISGVCYYFVMADGKFNW